MKYEDVSNSVVLDARLERHEVFDGASLRSRPTPMIVTAIGFFMIVLDTIVNVALPTIQKDLGGGISGMQWVSGGYADVFASFLLTGGALNDRFGARKAFLWELSRSSWRVLVSVAWRVLSLTSTSCACCKGIGAALTVCTTRGVKTFARLFQKLSGIVRGGETKIDIQKSHLYLLRFHVGSQPRNCDSEFGGRESKIFFFSL